MKPRVFFPTVMKRFDMSHAEEYGDIVAIDEGPVKPLRVRALSEHYARRLLDMRFNPDVDIIGLTGNTVAVALLLATVATMYGHARLLVFDSVTGKYDFKEVTWLASQST